ncbi:MAG: TonB-dependent receptor [Pseudomonadota bacterium]
MKRTIKKSVLVCGASLCLAGPVFAQDEQAESTGIETIIVEARKRAEDSQTIPVAVTAVPTEILSNEGAIDIRDLTGRVPNLIIDENAANPGGSSISIRGLSFEDVERSFEPTVGLVIDGVFLATNTAQLASTFDFESVEVLRGPQGTLFGRNTIGGVINVRRSRPTRDWNAKAQALFGEFGRQEFSGVVNAPLGENGGLKLFGFNRDFDGYFDNVTRGDQDGARNYLNYGGTVSYDLTSNFNALVTIEAQEFSGEPALVSLSQTGSDLICAGPFAPPSDCNLDVDQLFDRFETTTDFQDDYDLDEFDVTAELNWDITDDVTITSVTGYRDSDELQTQDFDGTSFPFFSTSRAQDYTQFTQELRVSGNIGDRFSGVAGFFLLDSEYELFQLTDSPLFADATLMSPGQISANAFQDTLSFAFFADVDFNVTDKLRLNLGGRYTDDRKRFRLNNAITFTALPLTVPVFDTTDPDQAALVGVSLRDDGLQEASFTDFSPRVSIDYQFTDDFFGYFSYSQGFRAGGFNGRAGGIVAATTVYEPEDVNSYELGIRTDWFDRRARLNLTGFYSKYKDRQEEIVVPTDVPPFQETVVQNASDATIWGIEMDGQLLLTDSFKLLGTFSYLDAAYDSFPVGGFDLSDLEFRRAPDITYSISAVYDEEIGPGDFNAGLTWRFVDDFQTTIVNANPDIVPAFNDPRGLSEAQGILNATLSYAMDISQTNVKFSVFGRNLTDSGGINNTLPVAGLFTFGVLDSPREFGGSVTIEY